MPDHAGFIIAAYGVTTVALAATILAVIVDYRSQRRAVDRLAGGREGAAGESRR